MFIPTSLGFMEKVINEHGCPTVIYIFFFLQLLKFLNNFLVFITLYFISRIGL